MEAIKVNLIPNGIPEACHTSQYDVGRQIRLDLFDGLTPYTIQAGDTFKLNVRKPDNHVITETVSGTAGNTYLVIDTTEQMTAVTGENLCEIRVENGGDNIGSLNFIMQVEKDVIANGIPSESVIEDLEYLISEAIGDNYYTKTETDELLAQKADVTDLLDLLPTDNASGAIANFTDGANNIPVKALSVEFAASQASGTPTPSAPIPITPVNLVKVTRTGKNLCGEMIYNYTVNSSGKIVITGGANSLAIAPIKNGQTYTLTTDDTNFVGGYFTEKPAPNSVTYNEGRIVSNNKTFTAPFDGWVAFRTSLDYTTPQLEVGSTATAYEAYNGVTKTLNLGGDYYGGSVDKDGNITLTRKIVDMGDLSWSYVPQNDLFSTYAISDLEVLPWDTVLEGKFLCECGKAKAPNTAWSNLENYEYGTLNGRIRFKDNHFTDAALFRNSVAGNKIMYPLATPIVLQASNAIELNTLLGDNNIFSDAGDVDVTIRADIALYIQKMLDGNVNRSLGANPSILRTGAISTDIEVREPVEPDSEPVELEREVDEQPENEGNDNEER